MERADIASLVASVQAPDVRELETSLGEVEQRIAAVRAQRDEIVWQGVESYRNRI
jgi:hypothetical protein